MAFQNSSRSMKGQISTNYKRSIDGESSPISFNGPHHPDFSNNFEFNLSELPHKPENVSKNRRTSSCEPHFFKQPELRSDTNDNLGYHSADSSHSSTSWKNLPRTPKTYPRTKITSNTPMAQRSALQNLRQHISFTNGDDVIENSNKRDEEDDDVHASGGLPDSHQIVSRLVQIRDCLKQIDSMINSLKETNTGAQIQEQVDRLMKVRGQMQNSETQLIDLYHKITLATREETVGAVDGKEKQELSDRHGSDNEELASVKDEPLNDLCNAMAGEINVQQTQHYHKKIIEKLQHKLDSGQVHKQKSQTPSSNTENSNRNQSPLPAYLLTSTQSNSDSSLGVNIVAPELPVHGSSGCVTQLSENAPIKDEVIESSPQGECHLESCQSKNEEYDHRKHLIKVLIAKKQQMNNILGELSAMSGNKAYPVAQNASTSLAVCEPNRDNSYEQKENNAYNNNVSKESLSDAFTLESITKAQELMKAIDARDKIRELNLMKQQLSELNEKLSSRTKLPDLDSISDVATASDTSSLKNFVADSSPHARKSSNLSKDSVSFRGRRDWSPEGHCSADEDNQSLPRAASLENHDHWTSRPSVRDKVTKLQEAKSKLVRLEELINSIQKARDEGRHLPHQCRELIEISEYADDDVVALNQYQNQSLSPDNFLKLKHATKVPHQSSSAPEPSSSIMDRKEKMEEILKEQMNLIEGQKQSSSFQKLALLNNKPKVSHKESNNWPNQSVKLEPAANFRFHPNFQSDADMAGLKDTRKPIKTTPNDSRYNSVMADLQQQHDALSELMKEEKKKQQTFLQNQDNQSVQAMKSVEPFGKAYSGSSADGIGLSSAATWGISTSHDNLNDRDDTNFDDSQEEPEDAYSEEDQDITHPMEIQQPHTEIVPPKIGSSMANANSIESTWNGLRSQVRTACSAYTRLNPVLQFERSSSERNRQDVNLTPEHEFLNDQAQRNPSSYANNGAVNYEANMFQHQSRNQPSYILQRLEENINLCQTILRDQQALSNYYQSYPNAAGSRGINPATMANDSQLSYNNIGQCFELIHQHKKDIQVLQMQFNQLLRGIEENRNHSPRMVNSENHIDVSQCSPHINNTMQSSASLYGPPPLIPPMLNTVDPSLFPATSPAMYGSFMNNHLFGNSVGATGHEHHDAPKTLNNQVPPGTRANNYWDNFRSCSRQNLLSVHKSNEHGGYQTVPSCLLPPNIYDPPSSVPSTQIEGRITPNRNDGNPYLAAASSLRTAGSSVEQSVGDENLLKKSEKRQKSNKEQKSDLKNVCVNNRAVLSPRQSVSNKRALHRSNPQPNVKPRVQKCDFDADAASSCGSQNYVYLDQLYSEAFALICENASQPMYLVELFRLLRSIKSGDIWQRTVSSLHEVISKYSMEANSSSPAKTQSNLADLPSGLVDNGSGKTFTVGAENQKIKSAAHSQSSEPSKNNTRKLNSMLLNQSAISKSTPVTQHLPNEFSSFLPHASHQMGGNKMSEPCQKSTGAIKKKRTCHSSQIEEEQIPQSILISTTQLNEKVVDIVSKILPFIKIHIDEPCQPKVLGGICKLTMSVTYETCTESLSVDSADLMQHQLKQILQDVTFKYNGQRMRDCLEFLLADVSEVVYNILAYYLLLKSAQEPSENALVSDKIKSMLKSLLSEPADLDFNFQCSSNEKPSEIVISTPQDCFLEISQSGNHSSKLPPITSNVTVEPITMYADQAISNADYEETSADAKPVSDSSFYNRETPNSLCKDRRITVDVEAEPEADISNKDLAEADQSPQQGAVQCSEREQVCSEVSDADKEFQPTCNGVRSPDNTEDDFGMVASGGIDVEPEETANAPCSELSGGVAHANSTSAVSIADNNEALSTESQQDLFRKSGTRSD